MFSPACVRKGLSIRPGERHPPRRDAGLWQGSGESSVVSLPHSAAGHNTGRAPCHGLNRNIGPQDTNTQ